MVPRLLRSGLSSNKTCTSIEKGWTAGLVRVPPSLEPIYRILVGVDAFSNSVGSRLLEYVQGLLSLEALHTKWGELSHQETGVGSTIPLERNGRPHDENQLDVGQRTNPTISTLGGGVAKVCLSDPCPAHSCGLFPSHSDDGRRPVRGPMGSLDVFR